MAIGTCALGQNQRWLITNPASLRPGHHVKGSSQLQGSAGADGRVKEGVSGSVFEQSCTCSLRATDVLIAFLIAIKCFNRCFKEMVLEGKSLVILWCSGESCTLPHDQTFQNIFVEILYLLLTDTDGGKWFFLQTKVRKLHLIVMSLKEKISVLYCSEGCASVLVSISQC